MSRPFTLQDLADRAAIEDVIVRYANAVDSRDFDRVATCFTPDASATFDGTALEPGADAIVAFLRRLPPLGERHVGAHAVSNVEITLDGDRAEAGSYAIVYSTRGVDAGTQVRLRAARYHDQLVRYGGEWRIRHRVHTVDWEGVATGVPVTSITGFSR